jgi:hypothetical protein
LTPGRRDGKPATNRLSYGAALLAVNPDRNLKTGKLKTNFKRHLAFRKADEFLVCSDEELETDSSYLHHYEYVQKTRYNF